ncbi:MAG: hypothetical protein JO001_03305 [Alphaproteobacteria bacterium]|nr:hypothetical protein [Alphaproteobacteria bacterium]
MPDRCAEVMRLAMPSATFETGNERSRSVGIDSITATVEAVRTDLPAGATVAPEVAVECRFDDGVLDGFRWTKGGPKQSP